jgi:hypothetical protein
MRSFVGLKLGLDALQKIWDDIGTVLAIACSSLDEGIDVRPLGFVVCCVRSDLCDQLITRTEEFHRARVCVCVEL